MAIDPSIPLGHPSSGASEDDQNPFTFLDQLGRMKKQQLDIQKEQAAQQKTQRELADDQYLGGLMQKHVNPDGDLDTVALLSDMQRDGKGPLALRFQDKVLGWRKDQALQLKEETDTGLKRLDLANRMAQGVMNSADPKAAFTRAMPAFKALVGEKIAAQMGTQFDPEVMRQMMNQGLAASETLTKQRDLFEQADKLIGRTREAIRDKQVWEKEKPDLINKWADTLGSQLALSHNEDDWQFGLRHARAVLDNLEPAMGGEVFSRFDEHYSPEAKERARLGGMSVVARSEEHARNITAGISQENVDLAKKRLDMQNGSAEDPEVITYWMRQIHNQTAFLHEIPGAALKQAVATGLAKDGLDLTKISQQTKQMAEAAQDLLPMIAETQRLAKKVNEMGLMGPVAGRWRDFMAGTIGAGDLAGGSKAKAELLGQFKASILLITGVARAHGGSRGGGSVGMLEHLSPLMDPGGNDFNTYSGGLTGVRSWMDNYASRLPPDQRLRSVSQAAIKKMMAANGWTYDQAVADAHKNHYVVEEK